MSTPQKPLASSGRIDSFRHALRGWRLLIATAPNARIHVAITLCALVFGTWLGIGLTEWAVIWLTIGLVFAAEFLNSALEDAVDLASPSLHPLAGRAKDMAAGGVLFVACAAVIIGLLIFGPRLLERVGPMFADFFAR